MHYLDFDRTPLFDMGFEREALETRLSGDHAAYAYRGHYERWSKTLSDGAVIRFETQPSIIDDVLYYRSATLSYIDDATSMRVARYEFTDRAGFLQAMKSVRMDVAQVESALRQAEPAVAPPKP